MRIQKILTLLLLVAFLLTACTSSEEVVPTATQEPAPTDLPKEEEPEPTTPPTPTSIPPTEEPDVLRVGLVSDVAGLDDRGWNAGAWKGLQAAKDQFGVEIAFLESTEESDYAPHISAFVDEGYDMIVTIGGSMAGQTRSAAEENPDIYFVLIGAIGDPPLPNLLGVTFSTDKIAFLGGYLAAGVSGTGIVGTYGGVEFPTVSMYMVGFGNGVDYYNQQKGTEVQVLGRDRYIGNFQSQEDGRAVAEEFIAEGADILMPVAGPAGRGSIPVIQENAGTLFIGVDFDWCEREEELCPITLTSIFNPIDQAVFWAVQQVIEGSFEAGVYEAVRVPPLHQFEEFVPADLKEELEIVRNGLEDGSISTGWVPPE